MRIRLILPILSLVSIGISDAQPLDIRLPDPPKQEMEWHPVPGAIPTNLLSAVSTIYDQGFPDPRGCEYREIEVQIGSLWSAKPSTVKTRGWVLPDSTELARRFAICWNGSIYPLVNSGAPADLHEETLNLPASRSRFQYPGIGEDASIISSNALSTRVLLLLRLEETDAALKAWTQVAPMIPTSFPQPQSARNRAPAEYDPYLLMAGDWAWALFDQVLFAHMRSDEALALASARKLSQVRPEIELEAARRGFPHQKSYQSSPNGKEGPYLNFLDQLPEILADLERRVTRSRSRQAAQSAQPNCCVDSRPRVC
jgi:hypothetical protein